MMNERNEKQGEHYVRHKSHNSLSLKKDDVEIVTSQSRAKAINFLFLCFSRFRVVCSPSQQMFTTEAHFQFHLQAQLDQ
jgi:hypothetical protein